MTEETKYYLTYIDDKGQFSLGEDVVVNWQPNGDFELSSPHIESKIYGTVDSALQNTALGLVAFLRPIVAHLDPLPRGTAVTPHWRSPDPRNN